MPRRPLATSVAFALIAVAAAACFDASEGEEPLVRFVDVARSVEGDGVLLYRVESYTAGGYDLVLAGESEPTRLPERLVRETWFRVEDGEFSEAVSRLSTADGEVLSVSAEPDVEEYLSIDRFRFLDLVEETRAAVIAGDFVVRPHEREGIDTLVRSREACVRTSERPEGEAVERVLVFSADFYPTGTNECVVLTPAGEELLLERSIASLEALPASAWPAIAALVEE